MTGVRVGDGAIIWSVPYSVDEYQVESDKHTQEEREREAECEIDRERNSIHNTFLIIIIMMMINS